MSTSYIVAINCFRIGLSSAGQLYEICLFTKTVRLFAEYDQFIEDIVILQATDNDIQLLLQTKAEGSCSSLKIVDFPGKLLVLIAEAHSIIEIVSAMHCHYELPIPLRTNLVSQSQSSVNLYYLEEIIRQDGIPQEIIMNLITESQPSERLKKLIRIGRLDEAEVMCDDAELCNIKSILFCHLTDVRETVQFEWSTHS